MKRVLTGTATHIWTTYNVPVELYYEYVEYLTKHKWAVVVLLESVDETFMLVGRKFPTNMMNLKAVGGEI